jgi:NAD-dependent SIR2 family protein deacetylase
MAHTTCQSCGMPLKKDPMGGGTEKDGSKSLSYCSKCYTDGAFINPNMTLAEMKALVKSKLQEMGFPSFVAWFFTLGIPKLDRWKQK